MSHMNIPTSTATLKSMKNPEANGAVLVMKMLKIVSAPIPIKAPMSKVELAS